MKELWHSFEDWCKDIGEMIKDHKTVSIAIAAFIVLVILAVVISVLIGKGSQASEVATSRSSTDAATEESMTVPEEPLEENVNADVVALIKEYYNAMAEGDTAKVASITTGYDAKELIKISKKSEYVESYPAINCYTKKGPDEDSYLVYVHYEVKLKDYEALIPGLNALYICKNEEGKFYINGETQSDEVLQYCEMLSAQDDVVDLVNTVQVHYNEIKSSNDALSTFLDDLPDILTAAVGEELAKIEAAENASEEPATEENTTETAEENPLEGQEVYVKVMDVVNVRSSDSQEADKVGKAQIGDEYLLLEEKENGWSKIKYEDEEAFIKSEFLEKQIDEEATEESSEDSAAEENSEEESSESSNDEVTDEEAAKNSPTEGKATAKETINLREKASTSSDKLAVVYKGEHVDVIMKQADGWSKVKYKKKTGYVKSEFLEK